MTVSQRPASPTVGVIPRAGADHRVVQPRHVRRATTEQSSVDEMLLRAWDFLEVCHREIPDKLGSLRHRWEQVRREVAETGTYRHTRAELVFGARVAWRNSVRCVGRIRWAS